MIACICYQVSEKEILDLAKQGLSLEDIKTQTKACTRCGSCEQYVEQLIEQFRFSSEAVASGC